MEPKGSPNPYSTPEWPRRTSSLGNLERGVMKGESGVCVVQLQSAVYAWVSKRRQECIECAGSID